MSSHRCGSGGRAVCAVPAGGPAQHKTPPALLGTSGLGGDEMQIGGQTASWEPRRIGSCTGPGPGEWGRPARLYHIKDKHGQAYEPEHAWWGMLSCSDLQESKPDMICNVQGWCARAKHLDKDTMHNSEHGKHLVANVAAFQTNCQLLENLLEH